jgi:PAS domain S-box-containing protein
MSVEAYLKVVDRLPEPYLVVSGEGVVLGANRRLSRLGIDPIGARGRRLADLTTQPPADVAAYLRRCSTTSDPVPGALTLRRDDGGEQSCRADGSVLEPGGQGAPAVVLLRLVFKDASVSRFLMLNRRIDDLGRQILKRRQAEEALREQKEWLGVTLASIGDAVIATDVDGRIIFMNPVAEALTGWSRDDAAGQPLNAVFRIIHEETRRTADDPVARCLLENAAVGLSNHTILIAKDQSERAIDDTAAPIREAGGTVKGVVLIFHDVGERRRMERELHDRAERLAENDRRKDEFLAMLAHELRNPLSSINNAVQLFGKLETEDDLEWAKGVVQRQVRHLARLIDDLLDASRISRGKISLRTDVVDLSPIIGAAVETVRPLMEERRHELSLSIANGGLRLQADPVRIEQVLVNLLTNAAKYTDAGGRIAVSARPQGSEIVVKVKDDGMGLPSELIPRIFDLFVQGDRTAARSEGGLGIGLTLAQKLVEMHGGTASAASEGVGKGSEFTIRLPALDASAVISPAAPPGPLSRAAAPPRHGGARVLVVDDNADTAEGIERFLKLLGSDVRVARDGAEAIAVARDQRPQIVLLDIGLPGMDGYEVARALRAEEFGKSALIIAVSGYGQPEDLRRSQDAGFDHHLVKPVDYDALTSLFTPHSG